MFVKRKQRWLKLNSVVLSVAVLFTTIVSGMSPSPSMAAPAGPTISQPQPVELPWYRNETTKVYGNPDGTLTAEVYSEPIHYQEGNNWLDINNTLEATTDGQSFTNKANKFKVTFPKKPRGNDLTRLFDYTIAGKSITFGLSNSAGNNAKLNTNPQDVVGEFKTNKAKFAALYPGVTFDYTVDGSKVKENIILNSYQGKTLLNL